MAKKPIKSFYVSMASLFVLCGTTSNAVAQQLSVISGVRLSVCTNDVALDVTEYRAARAASPGPAQAQAEAAAIAKLVVQESNLAGVVTPNIVLQSPGRTISINVKAATITAFMPDAASIDGKGAADIISSVAGFVFDTQNQAGSATEAGQLARSIRKARAAITAARVSVSLSSSRPTSAAQYSLEDAKKALNDAVLAAPNSLLGPFLLEKPLAEFLCAKLAAEGKVAMESIVSPAPNDFEEFRRRVVGLPAGNDALPEISAVPTSWKVTRDTALAPSDVALYLSIPADVATIGRRTEWTTPEGSIVLGLVLPARFPSDIRPCASVFAGLANRKFLELDQIAGVVLVVIDEKFPVAAASCSNGVIRMATGPDRKAVLMAVSTSTWQAEDPAIKATVSTTTMAIAAKSPPPPLAATATKSSSGNKAKTKKIPTKKTKK